MSCVHAMCWVHRCWAAYIEGLTLYSLVLAPNLNTAALSKSRASFARTHTPLRFVPCAARESITVSQRERQPHWHLTIKNPFYPTAHPRTRLTECGTWPSAHAAILMSIHCGRQAPEKPMQPTRNDTALQMNRTIRSKEASLTGAQVCEVQVAGSVGAQNSMLPRRGQVLQQHVAGGGAPKGRSLSDALQAELYAAHRLPILPHLVGALHYTLSWSGQVRSGSCLQAAVSCCYIGAQERAAGGAEATPQE